MNSIEFSWFVSLVLLIIPLNSNSFLFNLNRLLEGVRVGELHGNLSQPQRLEALRKFKDEEIDVLVSTDVAARGLDIPGVQTVINFTMPPTVERYIHRVGRTARAGRSG